MKAKNRNIQYKKTSRNKLEDLKTIENNPKAKKAKGESPVIINEDQVYVEAIDSINLDTSSEPELSTSKKFTCHHCKEVFSSEWNVKIHIDFYYDVENHDGKKPYKCLKCDFTFLQKEELSTHITSVHEIEKPYKCSNVTLVFSKKKN